ncbi:MAG: DivIVA domain-containing protein, partial [Acidimicrobiales bacterium]
MEVTAKTLREVEFREKMRGYHPEDVDQFLEQAAVGLEVLQDRLRQAVERAQRAEKAATENTGSDETLKRTLVLAQRTADLAVQEAREQAARILASAEQQAKALVGDAEERSRRAQDEALANVRAELSRLEASRAKMQAEVEGLNRWVEEHRGRLIASLKEALGLVERAGIGTPPRFSPERSAANPAAANPTEAVAPSPSPASAPERPPVATQDTMEW